MMTRGKPKDKAHRSSTHSMEFKDVEDLEVFKEKGSFCLYIPLSLLPLLCVHQHSCHNCNTNRVHTEQSKCCEHTFFEKLPSMLQNRKVASRTLEGEEIRK
jgi:hypothetical protein